MISDIFINVGREYLKVISSDRFQQTRKKHQKVQIKTFKGVGKYNSFLTNVNKSTRKYGGSMAKRSMARNPEQRENELIGLAMDLAESKLRDGTASSQIITTLINFASTKARLEIEKLKSDLKVADAKIEAMDTQKDIKELYEKALTAMKRYAGANDDEYEE